MSNPLIKQAANIAGSTAAKTFNNIGAAGAMSSRAGMTRSHGFLKTGWGRPVASIANLSGPMARNQTGASKGFSQAMPRVLSPSFGGAGGLASVASGMAMGGLSGYWASDGNKGWAIGGALSGAVGGAMVAKAAGRQAFTSITNKAIGKQSIFSPFRGRALEVANMLESKSSRAGLFAGGAMLSGGAFTALASGTGRSRKQGFNAHRGNSIYR
jgi:hypothetical protein